jgi:hypothetical protein
MTQSEANADERNRDPGTAIGRSRTGRIDSIRFTLATLDDREELARSRMADKGPTERLGLEA